MRARGITQPKAYFSGHISRNSFQKRERFVVRDDHRCRPLLRRTSRRLTMLGQRPASVCFRHTVVPPVPPSQQCIQQQPSSRISPISVTEVIIVELLARGKEKRIDVIWSNRPSVRPSHLPCHLGLTADAILSQLGLFEAQWRKKGR